MPTQILFPQLGESIVEGTVGAWLKAEGSRVEESEPLLELATDKVNVEIPSPAAGMLLRILVPEGELVNVGAILGWIGEPGERVPEADRPDQPGIDESADPPVTPGDPFAGGRHESPAPIRSAAGPAAGDRPIHSDDSLSPGTNLPLSPMRRAIAEHMVHSKHTSPHVTTVMDANMAQIVAHREANKHHLARRGVSLTFTAYIVAATARALAGNPLVNSSWVAEGILLKKEINIGLATALGDRGLIVPVIARADGRSLVELAQVISDLTGRARDGRLAPNEIANATFTITNYGVHGPLFGTPIINQPQCAILGVGLIQKRVVIIDDAIAIRPMVYLTLTFDHRILDGAAADAFLSTVIHTLENWV